MQIRITGDGGLQKLIKRLESFTGESAELIQGKLVSSMEQRTVPMAKALVPVKSGALRDSIAVEPGEKAMSADLIADQPGLWMELGEGPHTIEPRATKALHWSEGGEDHFAKKVEHPGIEPGKFAFMAPAVQETGPDVLDDVVKFIVSTIEGVAETAGTVS